MNVTVKWHGDKAKANVRKGAADGLLKAAEYVLEASRPLVPVADGEPNAGMLRDSGTASVDEGALRAAVSYGPWFAVRQHEAMDWRHTTGQAKYLEQPLNSGKDEVFQIIGREVKRELQS